MLRLYILFLAFIINTTLTRVWTIEGTWEHLLLQSMSMSIMFVFLFTICVLCLKIENITK